MASALALVPAAALAADWKDGDVFVGLSTGAYNVYDNGGTLLESVAQSAPPGRAVDCAFDRAGVLFTTAFDNSRVVRFLGPHPHALQPDLAVGPQPESISFARDGTYYVGHQANPSSIRRYTGVGTPISTFSPTFAAAMLDLSADQRTLFYTSRTSPTPPVVHRFDVQANTNLPDFADLGGTGRIADLKLLPPGDGSGGAIVAQTSVIKRVNGKGEVVQEYDVPGQDTWFGIALDPDGSSFWAQTATPGNVYRFRIAGGAVDRGPLPSAASAFGICVKGTRTAALDNAPPSIRLDAPADEATFTQGQDVKAAYSCADDANGTGVQSCVGSVASGAPLDTGSPGTKSFSVEAQDNAGNRAKVSRAYAVLAPGAKPRRIRVTMAFAFKVTTRRTTLTRLTVKKIPKGATLKASCGPRKGSKRCRVKTFTKRNASASVSVKRFLGKRLRPGSVVELRVTKPGRIGAVKLLKIRNRKAPTTATKCVPLNSKASRKRC